MKTIWHGCTHASKFVWHGIKKAGSATWSACKFVYKATKALVTGDLHIDKDLAQTHWGWNYNSRTQRATKGVINLGGGVTCGDCYVMFKAGLHFDLDVSHYHLNNIALYAYAKSKANMNLKFAFAKHGSAHFEKLIATVHFHSIHFLVSGIPFVIQPSMPIKIGYRFSTSAAANALATASLSGSVKFGFKGGCPYHHHKCSMHKINDHQFHRRGGLKQMHGKAKTDLIAYVEPSIAMKVEFIGGPVAGFKFGVELQSSFNDKASYCYAKKYKVEVASNVFMQATIGAFIDVHVGKTTLWKKRFGPWGIMSQKWPLGTGCLVPFNGRHSSNMLLVSRVSHSTSAHVATSTATGTQLANKGAAGCTRKSPCGLCHGDCDSDSDCRPGLKCFQRHAKCTIVGGCVVGCSTGGTGDKSGFDYCYKPKPRLINKGSSGCSAPGSRM